MVTAGCLLGAEPYNASGKARADSVLVMITAADFEYLLSSKVFREFIFSLFSKRTAELMQLVEEVAFQKLDRRLASLLVRRGRHIKVSHQELADELGTVREMITRLLKSFSDTGLIVLGRERIEILSRSGPVRGLRRRDQGGGGQRPAPEPRLSPVRPGGPAFAPIPAY